MNVTTAFSQDKHDIQSSLDLSALHVTFTTLRVMCNFVNYEVRPSNDHDDAPQALLIHMLLMSSFLPFLDDGHHSCSITSWDTFVFCLAPANTPLHVVVCRVVRVRDHHRLPYAHRLGFSQPCQHSLHHRQAGHSLSFSTVLRESTGYNSAPKPFSR